MQLGNEDFEYEILEYTYDSHKNLQSIRAGVIYNGIRIIVMTVNVNLQVVSIYDEKYYPIDALDCLISYIKDIIYYETKKERK